MGGDLRSLLLNFLVLSVAALNSLKNIWRNLPPNWVGSDPCGDDWVGIRCTNSRVSSITLGSMGLEGQLSDHISSLTELQILDLSQNLGMTGPLPASIGNLKKLTNFFLNHCRFTGLIPDAIGSLQQLVYLSLNSNNFSGQIPPSIGYLTNLNWLDLSNNQLEGSLPVSDGPTPGLDKLVKTLHFHLGQNKLSGEIPEQIFSSNMYLIHLLLDGNELIDPIPSTLGLAQSLLVVRLDNNYLSGNVPSNLNNLKNLTDLYLSNNTLSGTLPNLTGMSSLQTLDLSKNSFDSSAIPRWVSSLSSLTTLRMESTQLQGQVPTDLFNLPNLETIGLKDNHLNGTLSMGTKFNRLRLVDLQNNEIDGFSETGEHKIEIRLAGNPICDETRITEAYCARPQSNSTSLFTTPFSNYRPTRRCSSGQVYSPTCMCAHPYTGTLVFRVIFFSDLGNQTTYRALQDSLMQFFESNQFPVDSVSLSNPRMDSFKFLLLDLNVFPNGQASFNRTGVSMIAYAFTSLSYFPPPYTLYGTYFFLGEVYNYFADEPKNSKKSTIGIIIGAAGGGSLLLLLLLLAGIYALRQKKKAERASIESNPFGHWNVRKDNGSIPQLRGVRCFSFEELKKYTNNFSRTNNIGSGGYGKVYRGTLPNGELIAIKRAQQGSMQGKSGIILDWIRRLKVALGVARGLAYLHEFANPPIIHRDIKSANILLDQHLTTKVVDFGLSKPIDDSGKGHVTTQVKGTMGYMDPEYYMTQQLTDKSDVYSFGVLLLELITARKPIEQGKYIVKEVRMAMDKAKDLYSLHQILDPAILDTSLKGLEKFVDLAMSCVEESGVDRPRMGEVVKALEIIMHIAGMNPNVETPTSSASYEEASKGNHPFSDKSFDNSSTFLASN
ncbi:hypothetical protein SLEP1_g15481 [Rubroshorea leprosula]|uniref:non-specific serine/threonine protein kinase n=1 Tax=Rubroshorea leprosula TaxID=152421 RepID=A0AAV5IXY6_9ROSI|nr:hypothetical protein SLEP1_g15481 [Rubroshorea leprosula]